MDRNNTSNSSVCTKIRQALASNAAVRAIHRISSYHQEPKPITFGSSSSSSSSSSSPSPSPTNTIPQQHAKANKEASSGAIPIKFVNSTPMPPFVAPNSESTKSATQHVSMQGKPSTKIGQYGQHGHGHGHHGVHSEQLGKKSIDINETFNEYIQRAKKKIRTVSNIGRGQNNPASADHEPHGHGVTNKKEDHRDQFSEFIQRAKKKLRTTTFVGGRSSSLRKG